MREHDIIVIGGGPAGVAAATEAAGGGLSVGLVEMRAALGGAIYRQPIPGMAAIPPLPSLAGRWRALSEGLTASGAEVMTRRSFMGVDSTGAVLIDNRLSDVVEVYRPRALILACGALERVKPRPGWQLPGVVAAGGLQVMLKEGRAPRDRVLLAGSGPLLLALAAQMTTAGNAPVAVVEAGDPLANMSAALKLLASPHLLLDMAMLLKPILQRRFPWRRNTRIEAIEKIANGLVATLRSADGETERVEVDRIALHDGLRSNDFGLPADGAKNDMVVLRAGDVREVLGAHAAEADGRRAAREAAARIGGYQFPAALPIIQRERNVQAKLAALFASAGEDAALTNCPEETVICRCENRTLGELKALLSDEDIMSARELRLNGRFGMGACQGRFCLETTLSVMAALRADAPRIEATDVAGQRWPLRPVSLSALADAHVAEGRAAEDHHAAMTS